MSDYNVIKNLTIAIRQEIRAALDDESLDPSLEDLLVLTVPPDVLGTMIGPTDRGVNIYPFKVKPDPQLRNMHQPMRNADGTQVKETFIPVHVHYLVSFFGTPAGEDFDDLVLGAAGIVLLLFEGNPNIAGTGIDETIRLTLEELSESDVGKIYNEAPWRISLVYRAEPVILVGPKITRTVLPVTNRKIFALPGFAVLQTLSNVTPGISTTQFPLTTESAVLVRGTGLHVENLQLRIDNTTIPIPSGFTITDTTIKFNVTDLAPAFLKTGYHKFQVAKVLDTTTLNSPAYSSNALTLLIHPRISAVNWEPSTGTGAFSGNILVTIDPDPDGATSIELLINQNTATSPVALQISGVQDSGTTYSFPVIDLPDDLYIARLRIDGIESPLSQAMEPKIQPRISWPIP